MRDPFGSLDAAEVELLVRCPQPHMTPALATLTDARFSDENWIYERKLDGERCLVYRHGDAVDLRSRTDKPLAGQFPELVNAFRLIEADDVILDGEVVAFEGNRTSFARLQPRMHAANATPGFRGVIVYFYAFDLLYADGHDMRRLPTRRRKHVLRDAINFAGPIRYTAHRNTSGEAYFAQACARGWEGLIAKRADSPYPSGRSKDWLKLKCELAQEFVIGGYTDPEGSRHGFGALLIGYYGDDGLLSYAGKVGTGFGGEMLRYLHAEMRARAIDESPFGHGDLPRRAHWVRPELVGQVGFSEWTRDGRLRHPRFQGMRDDKVARDVVRERPS